MVPDTLARVPEMLDTPPMQGIAGIISFLILSKKMIIMYYIEQCMSKNSLPLLHACKQKWQTVLWHIGRKPIPSDMSRGALREKGKEACLQAKAADCFLAYRAKACPATCREVHCEKKGKKHACKKYISKIRRKVEGYMNRINRVIWIILDSVGMGELPDAADFDDVGTNTIVHVAQKHGGLKVPNMIKLGLGNIDGMSVIERCDSPIGCYGKMAELSNGKDTTIGHWEMTGIYSPNKFPTYPDGFPKDIIDKFISITGIPGVLGNKVASGTEIIKELGDEHVRTKKPIIYTSADSVFQIACHEDVYTPEQLYELCRKARELLNGENEVARVIARPFVGTDREGYERTANRRDFSKLPDKNNLLVKMKNKGIPVAAVGKIEDIFAKQGITEAVHTKDNMDGMDKTLDLMDKIDTGLIFTNLVEFDSKWGHRNDYEGYAEGLEAFDERLIEVMDKMQQNDLLFINADHGCDPTTKGTDHTREYVPLLVYGKGIKENVNLKTLKTFADVGQTIAEIFEIEKLSIGTSFLEKL